MTTLGNPHVRTPDWQVTAVFDPHGEGQDFAYTVGLFDRGLPELHLWARPSLGDDPGADWMFSPQDCFLILNELAWKLIDGEVAIGDGWEEPYDDGLVTCRFRLDPPGDRDELQALGIMPGAEVLPVRWSLHRRSDRPAAAARQEGRCSARPRSTPPSWPVSATTRPSPTAGRCRRRSSPAGSSARSRRWWPRGWPSSGRRTRSTWATCCGPATTMLQGGSITWPVAAAHALARDVGRVDEAARTQGRGDRRRRVADGPARLAADRARARRRHRLRAGRGRGRRSAPIGPRQPRRAPLDRPGHGGRRRPADEASSGSRAAAPG